MKKVTDLGPNECIHVRTPEEDLAIRTLMHEAGLRWGDGVPYNDAGHYGTFGSETVYYPSVGLYFECTIHPASDFLPSRELTIEEAEKEFNIKIKRS